jgi:rhamnogalacturonyl hydrolase YesR
MKISPYFLFGLKVNLSAKINTDTILIKHQFHIMKYLFLALILSFSCQAKGQLSKDQILETIQTGAHYAMTTVLDEAGKSRCDYNMTEGKWYPYEEPWHTGQVIYGLVEAYRATGEVHFLQAAKRAGDWWTSLEIKDHPKLQGMINAIHGDHAGEVIVFATVSDGTPGLFELWKETGIEKYASVPTQAGDWMLTNMCDLGKGVCYDNVDPASGDILTQNSPFHQGKENQGLFDVARPNTEGSLFLDMYYYTKKEAYKDAFITLSNSVVEKQGKDGLWMDFIPNHIEDQSFHPRFNLWYAESLLEAFDLTGDDQYLEAAQKTVDRYIQAQRSDGTIYYKNYQDGSFAEGSICGSSVAFTGLLMMRLMKSGISKEYADQIDLCAQWLYRNRFSKDHPDTNLAGAFMNIRTRNRKGKKWMVNRDIGTSFGLRFFAKYLTYKFGQ